VRGILRIPIAVLAIAVSAALSGCSSGSRDATAMTEEVTIQQFIWSLDDVRENPKDLAGWFASGSAPPAAELRKYAKYVPRPDGKPSVSGDTATAKVKLLDSREQEVGQVEWTFVKEGGHWKLKTAPLP
jgi:hypothetical protein